VRSIDESVATTTAPMATVTQANTQAERMKRLRIVISVGLPALDIRGGQRRLLHFKDANGFAVSYVYFEDEPGQSSAA
jgi:hypothetical protein